MKKFKYFLSALLLTIAGVGAASTFNLFQPATGILKGNSNTYVTTAAASADVISLWSGTCDASTFLKGDGSCEAAGGVPAGNDTEIQFNNGGMFGATDSLAWDSANLTLRIAGAIEPPAAVGPFGRPFTVNAGSGEGTTQGRGGVLTLKGGDSDPAGGIGGTVTVSGANGSGVGNGGAANLIGGLGGLDGGNGGGVVITAGTGRGGVANGGDVLVSAGQPGGGVGGSFIVQTGSPATERFEIDAAGAFLVGADPGTAGQVFTSNGPGTPPTWQAAGGGGPTLAGDNTWTGNNTWQGGFVLADDDSSSIFRIENASQRSIEFHDGSAVTSQIIDGADGLYLDAGFNPLRFWAGSSERFTLNSNGSWNVGGSTGTAGQVFTSNGAGAAPSWQNAGGGGGPTFMWANFNGDCSIFAASGFSSCNRTGAGDYELAISASVVAGNYACTVSPNAAGIASSVGTGSSTFLSVASRVVSTGAAQDTGNSVICLIPPP